MPGKKPRRLLQAPLLLWLPLLVLLAGCTGSSDDLWSVSKDRPLGELIAARNANRLYDGAPPVIPHEVASLGRENCLSCHTPGATTNGDVLAPPRSHPAWGDCRQCHVERRTEDTFQATTFEALRWPVSGRRQSKISPPMIPHHLQNRSDCSICHIGDQAPAAFRAAHGPRDQCRQCHVAMTGRGD